MIENKSQTEDQTSRQNEKGEEVRQRLTDQIKDSDIFKSLDIPTSTEHERTKEIAKTSDENAESDINLPSNEEEEAETNENEEDEDMVPKSKIQPRFDKLNAQLKAQAAEIEALKSKAIPDKLDETTQKLRNMSDNDLKSLKREVRIAQMNAKDDPAKLNELLDLEDKIEDTIRTAPTRFQNEQLTAYNKMALKIMADDSIKNIDEAAPKIVEMAKAIYVKYPKLQQDVEGQAIALEVAADRYKELSEYSLKKGSVQNLKSQVNTLKRKTSLDSKSSKVVDSGDVERLRKNAFSGNSRDKVDFVKGDPRFNVDAMIPAEYR